jgi:protein-disulfide isomerase
MRQRTSATWDYHELLFANQRSLSTTNLLGYPAQLGLDPERFRTCLDAEAARRQIEQDLAAAKALGATATPTFFINGIVVRGTQPL